MPPSRAFRLPRFAERALEGVRPSDIRMTSYDVPSREPTRAALERFVRTGELPPFEVPGTYALVGYEEATLHRHGLVDIALGMWERDPEEDGAHRMYVLLETEAFLEFGEFGLTDAAHVAMGLLAVRAIAGRDDLAALGADLAALATDELPALDVYDRVHTAAVAAIHATTDAAPGAEALTERTLQLLEIGWCGHLETEEDPWADDLATGGRVYVGECWGCLDASVWERGSTSGPVPIEEVDDRYVALIERLAPGWFEEFSRPRPFRWENADLDLVARPYRGCFLRGAVIEAAPG